MAQPSISSFYLIWATLLFGPPGALASFIWLRRRWPQSLSLIAFCCVLVLALVLGLRFSGFSFWKDFANYACASIAYVAYCFLAASCLRISSKTLRASGLFFTSVPIFIGYVSGTIGILGLAWTINELSEPPKQMSSDLICSINMWGSPASDSGYLVHLYKTWNWAPFLRREVYGVSVDQTIDQPEMSCSDVFANYTKETGPSTK